MSDDREWSCEEIRQLRREKFGVNHDVCIDFKCVACWDGDFPHYEKYIASLSEVGDLPGWFVGIQEIRLIRAMN